MKALEIPNLPDEIYDQIEKLARVRGTTVANVAADFLTKALTRADEAEARLMADIRADRERMAREGVWITDADVRAGREPARRTEDLLRLADGIRVGPGGDWLTPEYIRAARERGRE